MPMEYWQIIILGILQGITEFLPISSSGHLILAPVVFNFKDQGLAMDAMLHLATLFAIIIFFKNDLLKLVASLFRSDADPAYRRVAWSIVLATFPAGIAGLLWGKYIENNFRSPTLVGTSLLFWSCVFYVANYRATKAEAPIDRIEDICFRQVLFIGFAQALALVPGTSRSGITIAAGLFGNLSQTVAARFSFLLGTPIIFAAGAYKCLHILKSPAEAQIFTIGQLAMGFVVTFVFGYFSIKVLLKIVSKMGLMPFIVYRIVLSLFILLFYSN